METRGAGKNILVVGYPKSGNTWVTRLVAELTGCPVAGFWRSTKREIAAEGEDRVSDFRCFKSHHQRADLDTPDSPAPEATAGERCLIYVVRDPRDVTVSGAHHFRFQRFPALERFCARLPRGEKLFHHTLYPLLVPERYRLDRMTDAVLHGAPSVHPWCRISWKEHHRPYLHDPSALLVRYEDLLAQPEQECARILQHLGIARDAGFVRAAVEKQSFARKREQLLRKGETGKAKFLRVGKSEQWRDKLSPQNLARFEAELGPDLRHFSYPVAEPDRLLAQPAREPRLTAVTLGALQVGSAAALLASWWASHLHPARLPWPSLLVPVFLLASLIWFSMILNDLARRATLRLALASLAVFALSAIAVGLGARAWAGPPNPWREFGVSARWHRPAGATRVRALYTISHGGQTIATTAALPAHGDDWLIHCEDVDRDGLLDVIVEDGRGRSVLTFHTGHDGQPPAFEMIERTWPATMFHAPLPSLRSETASTSRKNGAMRLTL